MFDRFGNMNSAMEINVLAINLRKEGDVESILILASENGIDPDIADAFIEGDLLYLCDEVTAAIGKIEVEVKELKPAEIMKDWVEYLKSKCFEDSNLAAAVRRDSKNLKACIGALLEWSFKNQYEVDKDIIKASGISAGRVTLGIPGMGRAKDIMVTYYLGK